MLEKTAIRLDTNYNTFLDEVKSRLRTAQIKASLAVNSELIKFYWELGSSLIEKKKKFGWGNSILVQFSNDMRQAFPEMQGLSVTNLKRMRIFAIEYGDFLKGAHAVHLLPWGHIVVLLHRVSDKNKRNWYAQQTLDCGWSRSVLELHIKSDLYSRQGIAEKKLNNFDKILPQAMSDLARELQKDPYHFDFLGIGQEAHEREIENAMITHIRK